MSAQQAPDAVDFARVVEAIGLLADGDKADPLNVTSLASALHVSPSQLRRDFQSQAGITPKAFMQHLVAIHAKTLLRQARATLDVADDLGLSSPSRLHDLMVTVEAMTPGEVASKGRGSTVHVGVHATPYGMAVVAITERGICGLRFGADAEREALLAEVADEWAGAEVLRDDDATAPTAQLVRARIAGDRGQAVPILVKGTNLQIRVWRALLAIPEGQVSVYGDVAAAIGEPRAVRAVASAIGRNPVGYLIPCHRVLRSSGELAGYRWGIARKAGMLAAEGARSAAY